MADIAVENKEVPVVEKETVEEAAEVKNVEVEKPENGTEEPIAKENGDSEKTTDEDAPVVEEDEASNGDSKKEETNGDSTDAPAEAVKRKVVSDATESKIDEAATPEKKAKLDESKEVETNGAEATEVAA